MTRLYIGFLLCMGTLCWSPPAAANVFSLVQTSGPDLETPQVGETFEFEIHYEQLTNLGSLGFSVRTTGGVEIVSAVRSSDCYGPFPPSGCDFVTLSQAVPGAQFDVGESLAGPWAYVSNVFGMSGVAAGTVDDGIGPPGAVLGTVTVRYASPGSLEIFENAATDDQTFAPPAVVTPSFSAITLPSVSAPAYPFSVVFTDAVGDFDPPIDVDLVRVELSFDPTTGDYELAWEADPAHPFVGTFRLNANFYNADTGVNTPDPAFFTDTFNDVTLASSQTLVVLTGSEPRLMSWSAGDRVAPSCPDPIGCPASIITFLSSVGPLSGSAVGLDRLPPQSATIVDQSVGVPGLGMPGIGLLILLGGGVAIARLMERSRMSAGQSG